MTRLVLLPGLGTTAQLCVLLRLRLRAAKLGLKSSSVATSSTRWRMPSATPGLSLSALDTVAADTPSRSAMSFMRVLAATLHLPLRCVFGCTMGFAISHF